MVYATSDRVCYDVGCVAAGTTLRYTCLQIHRDRCKCSSIADICVAIAGNGVVTTHAFKKVLRSIWATESVIGDKCVV